jgi:hypothetical protein
LSHDPAKTHASFDDPNLVSRAGLVPVMALAARCGLADLAGEHVKIASRTGVYAHLKIPCLVAGMAAGADSIDDMDVLRHGAMTEVFGGIRAPSTLGSFLRSFTWGNVRQLDAVARQFLGALAAGTPLLPGAGVLAFIAHGLYAKTRVRARQAGRGTQKFTLTRFDSWSTVTFSRMNRAMIWSICGKRTCAGAWHCGCLAYSRVRERVSSDWRFPDRLGTAGCGANVAGPPGTGLPSAL